MKPYLIFALALIAGALLTACGSSLSEAETTSPQQTENEFEKPVVQDPEMFPTEAFQPGETEPEEVKVSSGDQARVQWPDGEVQLDEQGFVEVSVTPLNLNAREETLNFSVGLNTHSVDLSMDLAQLATLEADTGLGVQAVLWEAPRGGHHVSGILSFPTVAEGAPLLEGATQLTLKIHEVDAPERSFTWSRSG
jgi:hypothetical protein